MHQAYGTPALAALSPLNNAKGRGPTVIIMQGGAMRAAFGGGVLHEFAKRGFFANTLATASAGVPTATYYVADQVDDMHRIWANELNTANFIRYSNILTGKPIFNTEYLLRDVMQGKIPLAVDSLLASRVRLVFPLYDYVGKKLELRTSRDADFAQNMWSYLHLSIVIHDQDILWGTPFEHYVDGALDPFALFKLDFIPKNARVIVIWNEPKFNMHAVKYVGQKMFLALQGRNFPEEVKRMLRSRAALIEQGMKKYEDFCGAYKPTIIKPEPNIFDGFDVVARSGTHLEDLFRQGKSRARAMFDAGELSDFL